VYRAVKIALKTTYTSIGSNVILHSLQQLLSTNKKVIDRCFEPPHTKFFKRPYLGSKGHCPSKILSRTRTRYHQLEQESRAVAKETARCRSCPFPFKVRRRDHYKFKSSQASKARFQSSKHTGTKQNLTQNGDSRSFKVTLFGVSGKAKGTI